MVLLSFPPSFPLIIQTLEVNRVMFGVGFDNEYDYSGYGCVVYFNQDISV